MSDSALPCHRAIFYQPQHIDARHGELISIGNDPRVRVIDRLHSQSDELRELLADCPPEYAQDSGCWAYYPWRHSVVRVLGKEAFVRLRTDRNRNKISAAEQARLQQKSIAVIGLSVGHAIAFSIAQERLCGRLLLADHDQLSLSNLNRIPASLLDLSVDKSVLLARRIAEMDPYLRVDILPGGACAENIDAIFEGLDLLVDECDSLDMKFALRFAARARQVPVMMQTSDNGLLDIERFDLEAERPLFHGLVSVENPQQLSALSNADKVPLVLAILEADKITPRLAASMIEIDEQLSTWPQLSSDISLGAGLVATAIRRWGIGDALPSGRLRLDLDQQLAEPKPLPLPAKAQQHDRRDAKARVFSDRVMAAAARAPSGGNMQPWKFAVGKQGLDIYLDPQRSSLMDINYRGSLLAIGAALSNAEVCAAGEARGGAAAVLLDGAMSEHQRRGRAALVHLRFGRGSEPSLAALADMIELRACARRPGKSAPMDAAWRSAVERQAREAGVEAVFLQGRAQAEAAELWAEADRIRFLTPALHRELFAELSFAGDDPRTGIDLRTLEMSEKDQAALQVAKRADAMRELAQWDGGNRLGDASRQLIRDADALLVLSAAGNHDADYIAAGRLLQRLWLQAARAKVGLHPISPLFLYATSPSDLHGRVSQRHAAQMWQQRVDFCQLCAWAPEQAIALTLRVSSVVHTSARSQRERLHDKMWHSQPRKTRSGAERNAKVLDEG